ncbi:MAG: PQQ-binding-like beta-propeller repeat protein [Alphaproteobacteria bacterium]
MTIRRFLCLALGAGFLASCDLLDQDSGPKVAGTRLDIRHSARIDLPFVQADQTLQLAVPKEIPNWYQVGQNTKHVTGHIAFGGDWIKAWSVDIGEGISDGFALLAPPVASRDALYVMDAAAQVSRFDFNGRKIWSRSLVPPNEEIHGLSGGGLALTDTALIVTTMFGDVWALDLEGGDEFWRVNIGVPVTGNPMVNENMLLVQGLNGQATALSVKNGETLWVDLGIPSSPTFDRVGTSAMADNVIVYPGIGGEVVGLKPNDGGRLWVDFPVFQRTDSVLESAPTLSASPVIWRDFALVSARNGSFFSVDVMTGKRIWSLPFGLRDTPAVTDDVAFGIDNDQNLRAISLTDGKLFWSISLPEFENERKKEGVIAWFGPLIIDEKIMVFSSHGKMMEINPLSAVVEDEKDVVEAALAPIIVSNNAFLLSRDGKLVAYK